MDYSGAMWPGTPLRVERTLNAPSRCVGTFVLPVGLAVPVRRGRVVVSNEAGTVLFTGYLATEPVAVYSGMGTQGAVYRYVVDAVSDEWLLDRLTVPASGSGFGVAGGLVLRGLTQGVGGGAISTTGVADGRNIGVFQPVPTSAWSINAGALAGAAYGAYSVLGGALAFAPVGSVIHALSDGDGMLSPSGLSAGAVKDLANDVTVSGEMEPTAYVAEMFAGDGTTSVFVLSDAPLGVPSARSKLGDGQLRGEHLRSGRLAGDRSGVAPGLWRRWIDDDGRQRFRWTDDADRGPGDRDGWVASARGGSGCARHGERRHSVRALLRNRGAGELLRGI